MNRYFSLCSIAIPMWTEINKFDNLFGSFIFQVSIVFCTDPLYNYILCLSNLVNHYYLVPSLPCVLRICGSGGNWFLYNQTLFINFWVVFSCQPTFMEEHTDKFSSSFLLTIPTNDPWIKIQLTISIIHFKNAF